jgi:hypothetical protein
MEIGGDWKTSTISVLAEKFFQNHFPTLTDLKLYGVVVDLEVLTRVGRFNPKLSKLYLEDLSIYTESFRVPDLEEMEYTDEQAFIETAVKHHLWTHTMIETITVKDCGLREGRMDEYEPDGLSDIEQEVDDVDNGDEWELDSLYSDTSSKEEPDRLYSATSSNVLHHTPWHERSAKPIKAESEIEEHGIPADPCRRWLASFAVSHTAFSGRAFGEFKSRYR